MGHIHFIDYKNSKSLHFMFEHQCNNPLSMHHSRQIYSLVVKYMCNDPSL